jgi:hypothetical protein
MFIDEIVSFKVLREFKIHNFLKDFRESINENVIMWDQCYHVGVRCYLVG